jgi:diadenosine tetraphosphate (Ap4A) HIT family hydrolase
MTKHQDQCVICEQIRACRDGTHAGFIAELESGFAVLGEHQFFRGYSVLLSKEPAIELHELSPAMCEVYLREMSQLARAVAQVVRPHKLNYECLGNVVHHLHFHVFPRQLTDPDPTAPVWGQIPKGADLAAWKLNRERDAALAGEIREALQKAREGNERAAPNGAAREDGFQSRL